MDPVTWRFESPDGMLDINTPLFIYEHGLKVGIGRVIRCDDTWIYVNIEFTAEPRHGFLTYATVADAAGLE